jgi:hypothetical protein
MRSTITKFFANKWVGWFWTLLILVACAWPGKDIPEAPIAGFDKFVHSSLFIVWSILWLNIVPSSAGRVIAVGMLYGLALEFLQQLLPFDRTFDLWDALADAVGVLLGYLIKTKILDRYLQRLY